MEDPAHQAGALGISENSQIFAVAQPIAGSIVVSHVTLHAVGHQFLTFGDKRKIFGTQSGMHRAEDSVRVHALDTTVEGGESTDSSKYRKWHWSDRGRNVRQECYLSPDQYQWPAEGSHLRPMCDPWEPALAVRPKIEGVLNLLGLLQACSAPYRHLILQRLRGRINFFLP